MSLLYKCRILGCGGSDGVPQIACNCMVCTSADSRDKRMRSSILITTPTSKTVLVDSGPDFRLQALQHGLIELNGIIYTHCHYDHGGGIGDLRRFVRHGSMIPAFMDAHTKRELVRQFAYAFADENYSATHPNKILLPIEFAGEFAINDLTIQPFPQMHGDQLSYGFRFLNLAYSTDFHQMTDEMIEALVGVEIWIIDCLRYFEAATHCNLEKTVDCIAKIRPKRAVLTHMAHDMQYVELSEITTILSSALGITIEPAYDGMEIAFG